MRKGIYVLVALLLSVAAKTYFQAGSTHSQSFLVATASAQEVNPACVFPTTRPDPNDAKAVAETAWKIFVAANCPANNGEVWETWVEQLSLYPASGVAGVAGQQMVGKRLHGSPLAGVFMARMHHTTELAPNSECNPMQAKPLPPHVVKGATICEEVHINPAAQGFITGTGQMYQTRPPQTKAAQMKTDIEFPDAAVEVKVDWIPAASFQTPFTCTNPPTGVHVEMIDGTCYAMAGMHINSKLLKDWIWATFEPQNMVTNPWRCQIFGPCKDPWGSSPADSNGGAKGFTKPTADLTALMTQAGLPKEFLNYRLDGAQTTFTNPLDGTPNILSNSVIEGENVGMKKMTGECITCHSYSSIENNGIDGITKLPPGPVGPQYKIPAGWIARDFVWSLGLACPDVPKGGGLQTCTPSAGQEEMKH
jgi:hypothetical protein